jgi:nucleotide-binding universal stress UspA family protein
LLEAITLARLAGGRLRLVHVCDELALARVLESYEGRHDEWVNAVREEGQALLDQQRTSALSRGVECDALLLDNNSARLAELITDEADQWKADLIVIGTRGRRGFDRMMMGSGAESIARLANVPVLMVHAAQAEQHEIKVDQPIRVSLPSAALRIE